MANQHTKYVGRPAGLQMESISDAIGNASTQPRHNLVLSVTLLGNTGSPILPPPVKPGITNKLTYAANTAKHNGDNYSYFE